MIETLYNKMLDYLKMDTEISYQEFSDYYKQVMDELSANYQSYSREQAVSALFIMDNIKANSDSREKRKFPEAKKYRKISERSQVWVEALYLYLIKAGMTEEEIKEKMEQLYELA